MTVPNISCFQRQCAKTTRFVSFFHRISVVAGKRPKIIAKDHTIYVVSDARPQIPSPKITFWDYDCAKHIKFSMPMRQNYTFCIVFPLDFRRFAETARNEREKPNNTLFLTQGPKFLAPKYQFWTMTVPNISCFQRRCAETTYFVLFLRWISNPSFLGNGRKSSQKKKQFTSFLTQGPKFLARKYHKAFLDDDCAKHIMFSMPIRQNYAFCMVLLLDFRRFWETAENHRKKQYNVHRF